MPSRNHPTLGRVTLGPEQPIARRDALLLLAVMGGGVFLAGLELMVTAVALPAIVADVAGWTRLREASWIINGYLLVSVVTMPLAGRLADLRGTRRVFLWALVVFTVGSVLAGMAPTLEVLIAARLLQAVGGGALVPVATSAASHLFPGVGRPRALGLIAALTFLGMAAGPFLGAAILGAVHPAAALSQLGVESGSFPGSVLAPAWRWVFYVNVPIGIVAIVVAWAASSGWETPRRPGRLDIVGGILFSAFLVGALGALTLLGSRAEPESGGFDPMVVAAVLAVVAVVAGVATLVRGLRVRDPFLDPRLFRHAGFASATVVSALTGYALGDGDRRRRGVRRPRALRRPRRSAPGAGGARGGDGGGRARVRVHRPDAVAAARDRSSAWWRRRARWS